MNVSERAGKSCTVHWNPGPCKVNENWFEKVASPRNRGLQQQQQQQQHLTTTFIITNSCVVAKNDVNAHLSPKDTL